MGTSKSIPCLGPTWRGSSPYLQVNMKKLSLSQLPTHLWTRRGTDWTAPADLTKILEMIGNMGTWNGFICNTQWTDIQIKFHWSQKRTSAIPSPHSKRKAATLFFCRVAVSLGDPSTRLVDVIVEAAPRFFDSREVPMLENAQSCWPHLNHWPFFGIGITANVFFWNHKDRYGNIFEHIGSNSTQTPKHREWH